MLLVGAFFILELIRDVMVGAVNVQRMLHLVPVDPVLANSFKLLPGFDKVIVKVAARFICHLHLPNWNAPLKGCSPVVRLREGNDDLHQCVDVQH